MEQEIWKSVVGYEGIYEISNHARIRSLDHFVAHSNGRNRIQKGRFLKQHLSKKGYIQVSLSKSCISFNTGIHRLIAIAFIPNPDNKPQVNHINGVKLDNRIENLEWCTNRENVIHAVKNRLNNPNFCENHHRAKITNKQCLEIKNKLKNNQSQSSIAREYNVSQTCIFYIKTGKNWGSITKQINHEHTR